jgi:LacI family transcriptional regulator
MKPEHSLATIRDVARHAGVSTATVSRVISNNGYVSAAARRRVERAIKELAYVPNALARGLKTQRSGLIALLIPEIVNSFYTTVCRGVEDVANGAGLQVIVGNTDEDLAKERAYVDLMSASQVEGFVIASAGLSIQSLRPLLNKAIPTVLIDRRVDGFPGDIVRGDSETATLHLTEHLLALGHQHIAFVNGNLETSVARERDEGFRRALTSAGLPVVGDVITAGTWFIDDAENRVNALLDQEPSFTAIVAANNFMAIGALRALRRHGLQVPDDIAVVCVDDVEVAAEIDPFLTVMAQPAYTMGTLAMRLLLERIKGTFKGEPREVVLAPRLLVRRSCGSQLARSPLMINGLENREAVSLVESC